MAYRQQEIETAQSYAFLDKDLDNQRTLWWMCEERSLARATSGWLLRSRERESTSITSPATHPLIFTHEPLIPKKRFIQISHNRFDFASHHSHILQ